LDDATARYLNALNQHFYDTHADSFDATRAAAWAGWARLLPHLSLSAGMRVLDVGCGNGRFARFLADHLGNGAFMYHGTDSSAALLDHARASLVDLPDVTLEARDLILDPPPDAATDLIVLFGVLHHVPGVARRLALIRDLSGRVAPGGMLVFTAWRFADYERFRAHMLPWTSIDAGFALALEPGDHLLDWQRDASTPRYCHHIDDAEHDALIAASGLMAIDDYRADGFDGAVNRYTVLYRPRNSA